VDNRRFHLGSVIISGSSAGHVTAISSASASGAFNGVAVATCSGGHVVIIDTRAMRVLLMMGGHPAFVQALDSWPVCAVAHGSGSTASLDPRVFLTGCDDGILRKWSAFACLRPPRSNPDQPSPIFLPQECFCSRSLVHAQYAAPHQIHICGA
jgi:hypothetical protein